VARREWLRLEERVSTRARTHMVPAVARRAGEDPARADLAADSGGVGDEGAVLAFSGGRASSARVDGDLGVDALV
jgi:microcompartment protein CcmK/EutM